MAKRYKHNLSNYRIFSAPMGRLVPCQLQEILPGDSIRGSSTALIRFSPLVAPVMHPVTVRIHHWFVPHRLSWKYGDPDGSFEDFITGGPDGTDDQTVPTMQAFPVKGSSHDYLGVPPIQDGQLGINALPTWALSLIYDEWYRDQDLLPKRTPAGSSLPNICWEKDYLTTSRPTPQKGPDITIPLGDKAYVKGLGVETSTYPFNNEFVTESDGATRTYANAKKLNSDQDNGTFYAEQNPESPARPNIYVDLTQATAANVNDWRRAFALQRYQEARMRYGSRMSEYLRYLGVTPADSRLQRPEYLGGGKATVNFSEVLATAESNDVNVGELKGHGIAAVRTRPFTRHFSEHGYMISCLSVRPKTIYVNSIPRTFLRQTKEDFWQKELEQIGQQPVYKNEVYGNATDGFETFGWQDRYAEYKRTLSGVSGDFRDTLNFWHLGRITQENVTLNGDFVNCNPSDRIFADQNSSPLWCMVQNSTRARRLVRKSSSSRIL